jgi:hypothetical protein
VIALVDNWGYIAAAWIITAVVLATYAIVVIRRGRELAERVPPEQRRWMSSR